MHCQHLYIILCSQSRQPRKDFACICSKHAVNSPPGPDFRHRLAATEKNKAPLCSSHTESLTPSSIPSFSTSHLHQSWFPKLLAVLRWWVNSQRTHVLPRVVTGWCKEALVPKAVLKNHSFRMLSTATPLLVGMRSLLIKGVTFICLEMLKNITRITFLNHACLCMNKCVYICLFRVSFMSLNIFNFQRIIFSDRLIQIFQIT